MDFKKLISSVLGRPKNIGQMAEDKAARFLKKNAKLKILARNWRHGRYETDIVAYDRHTETIVFAEVKCRPKTAKVPGFYAATSKHKAECLKKCAFAYIAKKRAHDKNYRFDAVEVNHDGNGRIVEINHFENIRL
jgi:Holliday junction resolvase-like predicted endonuclease